MKLREKLMHKYALSEKGASDMIKAFVSVTISDLVLMVPISMLYFLVEDYMNGTLAGKGMFYLAGCLISMVLIAVTTYIQYNATFLSTYVESGVRRITLAEKLRKIPLFLLRKKGSVGPYKYDYGRLCNDGNGFFSFHTGTCRCVHINNAGCNRSVFL